MKSEAAFSFHLDGESSIDASLLAGIINNLAELTKLAACAEDPEAYVKINVTAFKNGSFQIDFSSVMELASNILTFMAPVPNLALTVTQTVQSYFEIKKLLKGEKPKSVESLPDGSVQIEADNGNTICASASGAAILNNVKIDNLVVNISSDVMAHNPSGGFSFISNNVDSHFSKEDVKDISKPLPIEEETQSCIRKRCNTTLKIKSADLLGHSQWTFIYSDKTIKARILDDDFIEKIHNGEVIKAGDCIKATLEIYVDVDELGRPIESSAKYSVITVHGDIFNPEDEDQLSLPTMNK